MITGVGSDGLPGRVREDAQASLLSVRKLCKDYSVRVLNEVDLELRAGEIHGLIGANGAGKSTLCQILAGNIRASGGAISLAGAAYAPHDKREAESFGVQIVQQQLNLVPSLTVGENLFINNLPHRFGWIDYTRLDADCTIALARVGLQGLDPRTRVDTLGVGTQQLIEIAAALIGNCRLLILDEPTAALTTADAERLIERIRELSTAGVSILYVSHRLDEVAELCERFTVLRDGQRITSRDTANASTQQMIELMAGDAATVATSFTSHCRKEVALRVTGLECGPRVRNVSLYVRAGERLGIAGLVGSGRTEILRTIFGAEVADQGMLEIGGVQRTPFTHPRQAVQSGFAFVTEDRLHDGLLAQASVRINVSLASMPQRFGVVDRSGEIARAQVRRSDLDIRLQNIEQPVEELSGGNQQKVVLAKWLEADADIYLFDEPTQGIDVAARNRISDLFEDLAAAGKAMVIVSSDLDELMAQCDAIVAVSRGRVIERFSRTTWTRRAIMRAAFGDE